MRLDDFDYQLPPELIASRPAEPRHSARQLISTPQGIADSTVLDLATQLRAGDLLVFNNTRVIPARLEGLRGAAKIELLLHRQRADGSWEAFAKPLKKLKDGDIIDIADGFRAQVIARVDDQVLLRFSTDTRTLGQCLEAHGHLPLPHYMNRADDAADKHSYQTLFAQKDGAVAAPTASLHFTPEVMARLSAKGIDHCFITLHVGAGTFQPVRVDNIKDHVMHAEWAEVLPEVAARINATKAKGGRIIAVGTTVMRTLESAALTQGLIPAQAGIPADSCSVSSIDPGFRGDDAIIKPYNGDTSIFITPGFQFKVVDALMTNFHLPKSTLIMLVAAFIGLERARAVYSHAITQKYRFYSYGDSSLLWP